MSTDHDHDGMTRRQLGKIAGAGALGAALASTTARMALAQSTPNPADIIKGVDETMMIHNAKLGVMETPLQLLREHEITPKEIMFIRNHFPPAGKQAWMASNDAPQITEWNIRIGGLAVRPRTITLDDLKGMEQVKVVSVMQCAGNGRSYFSAKSKVAGGQWQHGGMANVEWEGVPLRAVPEKADVAPADDARWLTANGADESPSPKGADMIKSHHIEDPALDNALLALKMNGEPIPAVHGGPLRLIIPGYYGNMNVKFLSELLYETEQSPSPFQSKAYGGDPTFGVAIGARTLGNPRVEPLLPGHATAICLARAVACGVHAATPPPGGSRPAWVSRFPKVDVDRGDPLST